MKTRLQTMIDIQRLFCALSALLLVFSFASAEYASDTKTVIIDSGRIQPDKLIKELSELPWLESIRIINCKSKPGDLLAVKNAFPSATFYASFQFHGETYSTDMKSTSLPSGKYTSEELLSFFSLMDQLEEADLTKLSLSVARMGAICDACPNVRFSFRFSVCGHRVTSDITAFSSLGGGDNPRRDESYFECLRFCPNLLALDLGHQKIKSVNFLQYFPQLRVLILADNQLDSEDLENIVRYCPHLEYLELFMNDIEDIQSLSGLTELQDLNIAHNKIADISPLLEMTQLQRCWIAHNQLTSEQQDLLLATLPNTSFEFDAWSSTSGWRGDHPHYKTIYKMFHEYTYYPFDE